MTKPLPNRPTVYLSNLASGRSTNRRHHGPGRLLLAMIAPRDFEVRSTEGRWLPQLSPHLSWLDGVRSGALSLADYRQRMEDKVLSYLSEGFLAPIPSGDVRAHRGLCFAAPTKDGMKLGGAVADGDTLLCGCARWEPGKERAHPCHLELLAPFLVSAGWDVVLWGRRISEGIAMFPDEKMFPNGANFARWIDLDDLPRVTPPPFYASYSAEDLGWPERGDMVEIGKLHNAVNDEPITVATTAGSFAGDPVGEA